MDLCTPPTKSNVDIAHSPWNGLPLNHVQGTTSDLMWVAKQFCTFASRRVSKTYRSTLKSLVDSQEPNGLELWRVLWVAVEGSASVVESACLSALNTFSECANNESLPRFLGEL